MSDVLIVIRKIIKTMIYMLCDLNVDLLNNEGANNDKVIRRCESDVSNRSYCASSVDVNLMENR